MKLLTRTSLYFFLTAIPLFVAAIFFCYYFINYELHENIDETLENSKMAVEKYIDKNDAEASRCFGVDSMQRYVLLTDNLVYDDVYYDTLIYSVAEKEKMPYRVLKSIYKKGNNYYEISVGRNAIETDDLFDAIIDSLSFVFGVVVLVLLIINYTVSRRSWKPFYRALASIRGFNLNTLQSPQFDQTRIVEFNQLNTALGQMTDKIARDYVSLRQFTENASHELQTPLAGIKLNLDLLIQSKKLGEEEMKVISRIYQSADKLMHLNKSLILLSKIENNQFKDEQKIQVDGLLKRIVENYSEMSEQKKLKVEIRLSHPLSIRMNAVLAEVLFGNLFQNAVKHNIPGGEITIESLGINKIKIGNTGQVLKSYKTEILFERFRKDDDSSTSIGLGLAIVKQVCDLYAIHLHYNSSGNRHELELSWPAE